MSPDTGYTGYFFGSFLLHKFDVPRDLRLYSESANKRLERVRSGKASPSGILRFSLG
jgi:hypothetical protein